MQRDFKRFLAETVTNELSDNLLANVVVRYYEKIQFEKPKNFFESVFEYYRLHEKDGFPEFQVEAEEVSEQLSGDYRLKSVRIANVRGIGERKSGIPFGINLLNDNNEVQNAIILGANGSGKSSLYSAVEYIYANQIGEALLRSKDDKVDFCDYLTRFSSSWDSAYCEIETMSGMFTLKNPIFKDQSVFKLINPKNHFISDHDIYEIGKLSFDGKAEGEYTFHHQVAISLGLEEYLRRADQISALSGYRRATESNTRLRLTREQNLEKLNFGKWQDEIKELEEKRKKINKDTDKVNSSPTSPTNNKELIEQFQRIDIPEIPKHGELILLISKFNKFYNKYLSFEELNESKSEIEFLNLGLELLGHENISGNCPLCHDSRLESETIKANVGEILYKLKELGQVSKDLNETYRSLIGELTFVKRQIEQVLFVLEKEISESKGSVILNKLTEKQEKLLQLLRKNLIHKHYDDLNELTSGILASSSGYAELFEYLSQNILYYNEELKILSDSVKLYSSERQSILEAIKKKSELVPSKVPVALELKQIEAEILQKKKAIADANKNIEALSKEIELVNKEVKLSDRILNEATSFRSKLIQKIDKLIVDAIQPVQETIEKILSDYVSEEEDDARIEVTISDSNERRILKAEIIRVSTNEVLSPNKYFNTFRYRLFSMMVSCSIAIASRKNTGLNLPLVLDDIFFASDYVSRSGMKRFLVRLVEIFEDQTPDLPLQFILFTHDDSIFSFAREALGEYDKLSLDKDGALRRSLTDNTILGRLYPYDETATDYAENKSDKYWDLISNLASRSKEKTIKNLLSKL